LFAKTQGIHIIDKTGPSYWGRYGVADLDEFNIVEVEESGQPQ
jgi:hypothetical protein